MEPLHGKRSTLLQANGGCWSSSPDASPREAPQSADDGGQLHGPALQEDGDHLLATGACAVLKHVDHSSWFQRVKAGCHLLYARGNLLRSLAALFCICLSLGATETYLFILLTKLHAPANFMGWCLFVGIIFEIPCWFFGVRLMDAIGHPKLQVLSMLGSAVRLYGFGHIADYHQALYCEIFHGGVFALPYLGIVVSFTRAMPEEVKATMTNFILTVFMGGSAGLGSLLGGTVVDEFLGKDVQAWFRLVSSVIFSLAVGFLLYDLVVAKRAV